MLEREIRALAFLKHPNIVTLYGVCYHADGAISIVEELAACDVVDFLKGAGGSGLALDHALKLALDIARGVAFMHANNLGHNDLKPANVLLCNGTAVLTDMGLVHMFTSVIGPGTLSSGALGTLPYMAPENMDPGDPYYLKSTADVYSFGCILFELATGKNPWHDQPTWGTMQFLRAVSIGKQRQSLDGVQEPLRSLIARCWREPAERPSAAALVQELTTLYTGAPPAVPDSEAMRRLVEACRRHAICPGYTCALRNLSAFDVVLICDDSSSMAAKLAQGDGAQTTRWAELKETAQVVTDLAAAVDDDGCDLYFLNKGAVRSVTDPAQAEAHFKKEPSGSTPLTATLVRALHDKGYALAEEGRPAAVGGGGGGGGAAAGGGAGPAKRLLFLIATDGVPNDGPEEFVATLQRLPENCYVQLVAVTDDPKVVEWMNSADDKVRFVDVNDDYWSERAEVLAMQGNGYPFTKGDYIAKVLLGAIDPFFFDLLDETRLPEGMKPLPFPSFPPLPGRLHYRSSCSEGGRGPSSNGGGFGGGGGGGK